MNGWRYYHTRNSKGSDYGFPDIVLVHAKKQRLIFAELKAEGKEPTEDQQEWLDDLTAVRMALKEFKVCLEVYVWHPSDIDTIWDILKR